MCLFSEVIKIKDGFIYNIEYHNKRFNKTRYDFFKSNDLIDLKDYIMIDERYKDGLYKCRIIYGRNIESVEITKYSFRKIKKLKLIYCDDIDYSYKYADRSYIEKLLEQKGEADDIIIVKNNKITDCSFGNLLFFDGRKFYTPETPLLKGTKMAYYLDNKVIEKRIITKDDLKNYKSVYIINAMIDIEDNIEIDVNDIIE